jgi:hypothetical protein
MMKEKLLYWSLIFKCYIVFTFITMTLNVKKLLGLSFYGTILYQWGCWVCLLVLMLIKVKREELRYMILAEVGAFRILA